jgi:hypothetical protein
MRRPPILAHAFFKQAVLQGEIGNDLLQGGGLTSKVLHLTGRRGAGRVARQPAPKEAMLQYDNAQELDNHS